MATSRANMDKRQRIKIYCLNVHHWETNKFSIREDIRHEDPDIILLQEHGQQNNIKIKIWNYTVIQQNVANELNDGTLIAIKKDLTYSIIEPFTEEILAINIHTTRGIITIGTAYQPPRRPYLLRTDFTRLFRRQNNSIGRPQRPL